MWRRNPEQAVLIALSLVLSACGIPHHGAGRQATIHQSVETAVAFLYENQLVDGEFPTSACGGAALTDCADDSTPFTTASVLYSLKEHQTEKIQAMVTGGVRFLLHQQETGGIWRYWHRGVPYDIDPDLDDTSTVSYVLRHYGVEFDDNIGLIQGNINHQGLFLTWINPQLTHNDVDCVVNANVLFYLGENPPRVCAYLNAEVLHARNCSHYYTNRLAQFYAYSRAYQSGAQCLTQHRDRIIAQVLARQADDGAFGSALNTALAVNTLLNFNYADAAVHSGVRNLMSRQNADGSWDADFLYKGPKDCIDCIYWKSEALSTALAVEALLKFAARPQ